MTELEYIQSQAVKMNRLRDLWKEIQIRQDAYCLPYGIDGRNGCRSCTERIHRYHEENLMEDKRPDENTIVQRYFENHVEPVMNQLYALGGDVGLIEGPAAIKLRDAINDAAIVLEIYFATCGIVRQ